MDSIKEILKEYYYIIEVILLLIAVVFIILFVQARNEKEIAVSKNNDYIFELSEKNEEYKEQINELRKTEKQQELINNISRLEGEQKTLETKKQSLEEEINSLQGEVIKIKGEPKTYPAGHLTVGTDIPAGKYKIYDGKSNFVVYSAYGDLEVNTILGSSYGVNEYIYDFKNGDKVEASSSFKLVAVE